MVKRGSHAHVVAMAVSGWLTTPTTGCGSRRDAVASLATIEAINSTTGVPTVGVRKASSEVFVRSARATETAPGLFKDL
jgi:hypothetical protein